MTLTLTLTLLLERLKDKLAFLGSALLRFRSLATTGREQTNKRGTRKGDATGDRCKRVTCAKREIFIRRKKKRTLEHSRLKT